jgi:hypothetical protein
MNSINAVNIRREKSRVNTARSRGNGMIATITEAIPIIRRKMPKRYVSAEGNETPRGARG